MSLPRFLRPLLLIFVVFGCAQADIIATIPASDGAFYDFSSSFPPASISLGIFTFAIPKGDAVTGGTVSGTFGNADFSTSALADLFVLNGTIEVGSCDSSPDGLGGTNFPPCFTGTTNGSLVPWSYTFTAGDLSKLSSDFAAGSLDLTAVQTFFGSFDVGRSTLDLQVTPVPEPASMLTLAGGVFLLGFLMRRKKAAIAALAVLAIAAAPSAVKAQPVTWTASSSPIQTTLAGGPWTLSQGPATSTYCSAGLPVVNPAGTVSTMQPFYFPFVTGRGNSLQGYFDYRPRNINESLVAANSTDGGQTWHFQQQVASLSADCPTTTPASGNDDGVGHPYVLSFAGTNWLYLLDRRNSYVDSSGLIVQRLTPNNGAGQPLNPVAGNTTFTPPTSLPAGASLITGWNFNNLSTNTNNAPTPSTGTGTATPLGMTNSYTYSTTPPTVGSTVKCDITTTSGSTDPAINFTSNSWRVRGPKGASGTAGQGDGWNTAAPQFTQGVEFDVNTTGFFHIVFQYDWYVTGDGVRNLQAQYNPNIANTNAWTNVGPVQTTPDGGGFVDQITIDFNALGITSVENNPNFGVRLVSVYDSTYTGVGAPTYTGASLTNGQPIVYDNNSGNWRFDEINFFGNNSASIVTSPLSAATPVRTTGLLNPDGILAAVPNTYPAKVLYIQKQLEGDFAFPSSRTCAGASANQDVETVRLATTTNGTTFTDLGPVNGLNDSTTVSASGIRYIAPNGSLVRLPNGKWGLFFGAGTCLDNDSDGFHAIAYAESSDLVNWTVINGLNNPIASRPTVTVTDQATGSTVTVPATPPVIGATQTWYAGRVYNPMAMWNNSGQISLIFDGYNAGYSTDLSSYRTIGQVFLSSGGVVLP
jgi:hypothetical protein